MKPSPEEQEMSVTTTTETRLVVCDTEERPHKYSAMLCRNPRPALQPVLDAGEWQQVNRAANMIDIVDDEGVLASVARWRSGVAGTEAEADRIAAQIVSDHRSAAAAPKLVEALKAAFDFYMGDGACGDFTCNCGDLERCGICGIRESTRAALLAAGEQPQ